MKLEVVSGKLKCIRKETFEKVQCPLNYSFTTGYDNSSRFVLSNCIQYDTTCFWYGFAV